MKIKVNSKIGLSLQIARGVLKSSKRKEKLYENVLKNRNSLNKGNYETFTRLFESIKQNSKNNYRHYFLITYGNDMKRTWKNSTKEIIGPKKQTRTLSLKRLVANDLEIFDQRTSTENFIFFSEIGPKLASKIPHSLISFEQFLHGHCPS